MRLTWRLCGNIFLGIFIVQDYFLIVNRFRRIFIMFFEGCIRRLSAAVQIAIQCQHICGRAFIRHPQKAKKPPSGGIFYYFFCLPLCVNPNNSVYLMCHRYKICLLKSLGGHGGSSYAHARGLHRAARFVRYAVFIECDGVFV